MPTITNQDVQTDIQKLIISLLSEMLNAKWQKEID